MHKVFGEKGNKQFVDRVGAYLIPVHNNKIAVVETPKGLFLLGGGIENGESDEEAIKRECLEEIGYNVYIDEALCSAEAYSYNPKVGPFHPIQRYYTGKLLDKVQEPTETDHKLLWLAKEELIGNMFADMQSWAIEQASCNKIKWLFFDIGSTLVDESKCIKKRCEVILENNDIDRNVFYDKVYELARTDHFAVRTAAKYFGVEIPRWYGELECLYPDVEKTLKSLSKNYKLGIIANQVAGTAERLEKWGIRKYFDVIISSAEEGVEKPDRRIFELALSRAGCKPSEAFMIGDRLDNDIKPAKEMGMNTIWVRQGFAEYQEVQNSIEEPDYIVNSINDIINIF